MSADDALKIARAALRRLSLNDEMAGMGQRDGDPELTARCRHAAHALADMDAALDDDLPQTPPSSAVSRFDRDPEALAWARERVGHTIGWLRHMEHQAVERGHDSLTQWRFTRNVIEREFIGGEGCVIAAFDKRRPDLPPEVPW